jgi:cardiolipin synthase
VVFTEGDELYDAMIGDINRARESIRLESYIFAGDEIGKRFTAALAERAQANVTVQLHLDPAGALFEGTDSLVQILQRAGVEVRWFNRWRWSQPLRYDRRNHRKLLVIDNKSVFVGGFNIHRQSSRMYVDLRRWRDVHVRISDHLIDQAKELFDDLWDRCKTRKLPPWDGPYRLIPNSTFACRRVLRCLYINQFENAKKSIYLATPYFVPDRHFRGALVAAAKRGVDVRILLPARSDQRLVQWAGHALARSMSLQGVKFYAYLPRMLHSKTTLIDGCWSMVGSANADYRSFFINHELNLISQSMHLCQQLNTIFHADLAQAQALKWPAKRSYSLRSVGEWLLHRLRRWM